MAEHVQTCNCRVVVHDGGVDLHRCALHQAAGDMRVLLEELLLLAAARGRHHDDQLQDLARRTGMALGLPLLQAGAPSDALDRLRRSLRSSDD
jgi:hypothetical protein